MWSLDYLVCVDTERGYSYVMFTSTQKLIYKHYYAPEPLSLCIVAPWQGKTVMRAAEDARV